VVHSILGIQHLTDPRSDLRYAPKSMLWRDFRVVLRDGDELSPPYSMLANLDIEIELSQEELNVIEMLGWNCRIRMERT
jgi:hypothetical protein